MFSYFLIVVDRAAISNYTFYYIIRTILIEVYQKWHFFGGEIIICILIKYKLTSCDRSFIRLKLRIYVQSRVIECECRFLKNQKYQCSYSSEDWFWKKLGILKDPSQKCMFQNRTFYNIVLTLKQDLNNFFYFKAWQFLKFSISKHDNSQTFFILKHDFFNIKARPFTKFFTLKQDISQNSLS